MSGCRSHQTKIWLPAQLSKVDYSKFFLAGVSRIGNPVNKVRGMVKIPAPTRIQHHPQKLKTSIPYGVKTGGNLTELASWCNCLTFYSVSHNKA